MEQIIEHILKAGGLPTILIGIIGYFFKQQLAESKEHRVKVEGKIDDIKNTLGKQDTELAVIERQLTDHIKADEHVQSEIDKKLDRINNKLKIA